VASAVVAALDAPAGVYDVVDDEPLTRREQDRALAAAVGRRRLWRMLGWLKPKQASYLVASQRVSNRRFRDATGWRPTSPSMRTGYPKLARALDLEPAPRGSTRLIVWLLAISAFAVGIQAAFFPRSFYDDFSFGRGWVAMDGRYNEHLIRDVGELNLALFVVTIAAIVVASMMVVRIAALAWLVSALPHFLYHLRHLTMDMAGAEKVGLMVSLALPVIGALVLLWPRRRARTPDAIDVTGEVTSAGEARPLHVSRA